MHGFNLPPPPHTSPQAILLYFSPILASFFFLIFIKNEFPKPGSLLPFLDQKISQYIAAVHA